MRDEDIFDDNLGEKPKGSVGYWLALVLVAVVFALVAAFVPMLISTLSA